MTKTDWTAEEVRTIGAWCQENSSGTYRNSAIAAHMLAHLANRIEADERAVKPQGFGIACTVTWTELFNAMTTDGMNPPNKCGPATRNWIEQVVRDYLNHPPAQEQPGWKVPEGWEVDVGNKSIAIRCKDGRKAVLRSDIGLTYNDRVVFDYFTAASPTPPKEN